MIHKYLVQIIFRKIYKHFNLIFKLFVSRGRYKYVVYQITERGNASVSKLFFSCFPSLLFLCFMLCNCWSRFHISTFLLKMFNQLSSLPNIVIITVFGVERVHVSTLPYNPKMLSVWFDEFLTDVNTHVITTLIRI